MPSFVLDTEREPVYLKQLTLADAPAYYEAVNASRAHLSQFDDETAAKYPDIDSVRESILHPAVDKFRLGIWDALTFVGSINLTTDRDGLQAEIGYWLDVRHTGNGYATLATKALATFASRQYPRLFAKVAEGNESSTKVLERSGFHQAAKEAGRLVFEFEAAQK